MLQDLTKTGVQLLLELINVANATFFEEGDITFGLPSPINGEYNTALIIEGTGTTSFEGPETVHYNRLDLATLFTSTDLSFPYSPELLTTHQLLPLINASYPLNLTVDDVINDPVVLGENGVHTQRVRATASSRVYIGEVTLNLTESVAVTTVNMQLTDPTLVDLDGNLYALDAYGWTITNGSLYHVESDEYVLALRAYDDNAWVRDSDAEGRYHLTEVYDTSGYWYVTLVTKLIEGVFDDTRELQLLVNNTDLPEQPTTTLVLTNSEAGWSFNSGDASISIPVAYVVDGVMEVDIRPYVLANGLGAAVNPDDGMLGHFKFELRLVNTVTASVVGSASILVDVPGGIAYPYSTYHTTLSGGLTDSEGMLLMAPDSPATQWTVGEGRSNRVGVRAIGVSSEPVPAEADPKSDGPGEFTFYPILSVADRGNNWFVDMVWQVDNGVVLQDVIPRFEIAGGSGGGDGGGMMLMAEGGGPMVIYRLQRDLEGNFEFVDVYNEVYPPLTPTYVSEDESVVQLRLDMTAFNLSTTGGAPGPDGETVPLGDFSILVENYVVGESITFSEVGQSVNVTATNASSALEGVATMQVIGENGVVYFIAPSSTKMMAEGKFVSIVSDGVDPELEPIEYGYGQADAEVGKIVDGQLYLSFYYPGYASQYTGTVTQITLYGCDPTTGDVVQTHPLSDIAWTFDQSQYTLSDMPTLDPNLLWRASLQYSLINSVGDGDVVGSMDVYVASSASYTLVSIDGTVLNVPWTVSNTQRRTGMGVVYEADTGALSISYADHTAVVQVDGINRTFPFTMIGW